MEQPLAAAAEPERCFGSFGNNPQPFLTVAETESHSESDHAQDKVDYDNRSLHTAAFEMHSRLPRRFVSPLVQALTWFSLMGLIEWGTVFTGCGIAEEAIDALKAVWMNLYCLEVHLTQVLMCESDACKIRFLLKTNPCEFLSADAADLTKPTAVNARTGLKDIVPFVFMLIAGFMCCDKTPANPNAKKMKTSMQSGEGQTSSTFEMILSYIGLAQPVLLILENVKEMLTFDHDISGTNDAQWAMLEIDGIV